MKTQCGLVLAFLLVAGQCATFARAADTSLVLKGAKVCPSPTAGAIDDAVVVIVHIIFSSRR